MKKYKVAVIPGDGIGKEVVPEGQKVLEAAARKHGFALNWQHFDWSCDRFLKSGEFMPKDGIDQLRGFDAIYLGAVGWPGIPDHVSLWGLLIPIRRSFEQYINLRPVRLLQGVPCPLAGKKPGDINYWIVRENCEGEYSNVGGRMFEGTEAEMAMQQSIFTKRGTDRVLRYAFNLAQSRPRKRLTSATKSNGIIHTMPYWDERVKAIAAEYPEVKVDVYHIDILCAHFVRFPERFDVVVGSNLFGDILSDLGPATTGTIAIAPGANLNPEKKHPSMFEPVHGSAPDIFGKKVANPIGQIWSGAMMLDHFGETKAAAAIVSAIEDVVGGGGPRTPDMGGQASTSDLGAAIAAQVR
jgi:tartrate dehydrogenase/decarboxylase/D-malate dehydrogenase